jgi:hypothetical protein
MNKPAMFSVAVVSLITTAGCLEDDDDDGIVPITKEEARRLADAGSPRDFCTEQRYYNDNTCDNFCLERDPDCATDERTPELGGAPLRVLASTMRMSSGLAYAGTPSTESKFELDDTGKLSLSVYPVDTLALDAERSSFTELAGDPTGAGWNPEVSVLDDFEHLTRSSRDLTLVQISSRSLAEVVAEMEQRGFVYWAIPTIQEGRAGYGVYMVVPSAIDEGARDEEDEDDDEDEDDEDDEDEGERHEGARMHSIYRFVDGGGSRVSQIVDLGEGPGLEATDARVPELGADLSVLRTSRISMADALRQIEPIHGPTIETKFELDDAGKLSLSIYPVKSLAADAEKQTFTELFGDPTAATYAPASKTFTVPDAEHLTRSARDLTLVQTASLSLLKAVELAEQKVPGGFVYWAIPTVRNGRSKYGIYVLDAANRPHYVFIS